MGKILVRAKKLLILKPANAADGDVFVYHRGFECTDDGPNEE